MAYLAINGYELPSPKRGVSPVVTTLVDSGRNANGTVVAQRIGRDQYKIDNLEWPWLTAEQWETILSILSNFLWMLLLLTLLPIPGKQSKCTVVTGLPNPTGLMMMASLRITRIAR